MPSFKHSLRPVFTEILYEHLQKGKTINLIGKKGTGRTRLLEDLAQAARADGLAVLLVDMNAYKYNYKGFIEEIQLQISRLLTSSPVPVREIQMPISDATELVPISTPLASFLNNTQYPLFLLFDNFDRILNNENQHFPLQFFHDLNSIRNHKSHIGICLATEKPYHEYVILFKDEVVKDRLSQFQPEITDMEPLTRQDVRQEWARRMANNPFWAKETQQHRFVEAVCTHSMPLDFLEYLVQYYPYRDGMRSKKFIRLYRRRFNRNHKPRRSLATWLDKKLDYLLGKVEKIATIYSKLKDKKDKA